MIGRHLTDALLAALGDTPVVLLHGPRQSGKSTLVRWVAENKHPAAYFTLDDAALLSAVNRDPDAFLRGMRGAMVIDEAQFAPDLFRAIKLDVDRKRTPGRFLLTGSANVMMLPKISESLAGRMEVLNLWPFSQGELAGVREEFVDRLFEADHFGDLSHRELPPDKLMECIITGGYPEVVQRPDPGRRRAWFGSYITTILQWDVREMAQVEDLTALPRMLFLLAAQSGGLLNMSELSRDVGLSQPTVKKYLALLRATHLYQPMSAWSANTRKRLIKSEKVYLNDTGLLAYLLGVDAGRAERPTSKIGGLLEAFVCQELRKQIGWSRSQPSIYYYRTSTGREVDFVLEHRNGQLVGLEVKAAIKIGRDDFRGLEDLADTAGNKFRAGVLLYQGTSIVPFGLRLWAIPVSAMFAA